MIDDAVPSLPPDGEEEKDEEEKEEKEEEKIPPASTNVLHWIIYALIDGAEEEYGSFFIEGSRKRF